MDLGLTGRRAIVCASSRGLGRACAEALANEGVEVTINGRNGAVVEQTAREITFRTGASVSVAVGDVTTEQGRTALLSVCPAPDILVTNVGEPPLGDFREWDEVVWQAALNNLMVSPILLIRSVIDSMIERRFGRIVSISSVAVRMPAPDRGLTNGARSGLSGFLGGLARQVAPFGVTVNSLLPGFFDTDRGRQAISQRASRANIPEREFEAQFLSTIPAARLGRSEELASLCAYLCSTGAAYVTGQNIVMDGGLSPVR